MPLVCCGVVRILLCEVYPANWLEEYFDKNGEYESRYEGKLKYRVLTMMWSEG